jgi:hypothetical protein
MTISTGNESPPVGWITLTLLDDGEEILYGMFDTIERAENFGSKLINAVIHPVYPPALH